MGGLSFYIQCSSVTIAGFIWLAGVLGDHHHLQRQTSGG